MEPSVAEVPQLEGPINVVAEEIRKLDAVGDVAVGEKRVIEHKAVLEPLEHLEKQGFDVAWVDCDQSGAVSADEVSSSYSPSHVLTAMGLSEDEIAGAVRMSWCHLTPDVDWGRVVGVIQSLR